MNSQELIENLLGANFMALRPCPWCGGGLDDRYFSRYVRLECERGCGYYVRLTQGEFEEFFIKRSEGEEHGT